MILAAGDLRDQMRDLAATSRLPSCSITQDDAAAERVSH